MRRRRGRGGGAVRANGSVPRARARLLCGSSPPLRPPRSAPVPRSSRVHGARSDPARARVPCARGAPAFFFLVIVHQTAHAPAPSPAALRANLGPRQGSSPRGRSAPRAPRRPRRALSFPSHRKKKKKKKKRCERARNQIKSQRRRRTSDRSFQRRVAHVTRLGEFLPHGRSVLVTWTSSSCTACLCRAPTKVRQSDGTTANQTQQNGPGYFPNSIRSGHARAPFRIVRLFAAGSFDGFDFLPRSAPQARQRHARMCDQTASSARRGATNKGSMSYRVCCIPVLNAT